VGDRIRGISNIEEEISCKNWLLNRLLSHGMEDNFVESTMDSFTNIFINRDPQWTEILQCTLSSSNTSDDLKKLFHMIIPIIPVDDQSVSTYINTNKKGLGYILFIKSHL
jgi:hypothetical protein